MGGCAALILAGGSGSRLGGAVAKQYMDLGGKPLLRYALEAFAGHPRIDTLQVVIADGDRAHYDRAAAGFSLPPAVAGGATRQESARLGLEALAAQAPDTVLIHDAARPFPDRATVDRVIDALAAHEAALPALPVTDTLKRSAGTPPVVEATLDRAGLWRAQTPQGFRFAAILEAHRAAAGADLTDDAAVCEHAGIAVALVEGSEDNFKITTAADLARAERLVRGMTGDIRVGNGYDVHAFGDGDHVMLCGVRVPHDHGLVGHSDADVAMHAVTDALLGAIAAGDIGTHFPPSDPQWKDAESRIFLERAAALVADKGGAISNVDLTIVCEAPKVGPHRDAMRAALAALLGVEEARVSVKATTSEKLGFTGRKEGVSAHATAVVRLP